MNYLPHRIFCAPLWASGLMFWVFAGVSPAHAATGSIPVTKEAPANAAQIRLFSGPAEWDLKDDVRVDLESGAVTGASYRKVCTAFGQCRSERTEAFQAAALSSADLAKLQGAIAAVRNLRPEPGWEAATPTRGELCQFASRFVYQVPQPTQKERVGTRRDDIRVAEFQACSGRRLAVTSALEIERVLNIAAGNLGL